MEGRLLPKQRTGVRFSLLALCRVLSGRAADCNPAKAGSTPARDSMSEAFIKYTALLVLLHHEMRSGHDGGPTDDGQDSPADLIRNQMEEPWYAMSAEEQDLVSQISEMAYVLEETAQMLP